MTSGTASGGEIQVNEIWDYTPDWRGIEDVTLIEMNGVYFVKVERRWIGVSKVVVIRTCNVIYN